MVAPVVAAAAITAGAALASAYAQWRNSEEARKANKNDLERIDEMFSRLQEPKFDANGVEIPSFDETTLTPEDFKLVQKYMPQAAPYVAEAAPQLVKETEGMRTGRDAQMDALQRFRDISKNGKDPVLAAQLAEANRNSQIQAQSREQSILQDAARRGQLGAGQVLGAQLSSSADSMNRGAIQSQNAAAEAYRNRLEALRQSAALGGDIRSQDENMEARNAGIINAFNQRTAANAQNYQNRYADTMNEGQRFNIGQAQDIANRNVDQGNRAKFANREREDALAQFRYKALLGEQQRQNDLKQQGFENQYRILQGRSGQIGQGINFRNQSTADQNQLYQGLGNTIGAGAQWYGSQAAEDERQDKYMKAKYGNKYES